MKIAFLSTSDLEGFFVYDELTLPHFAASGVEVDTVPWRKTINWNQYDAVIVRSTWDYQQAPEDFLTCLAQIEASSAVLINPYSLMAWNIKKTYLKDLDNQGVAIVPTLWATGIDKSQIDAAFEAFSTDTIIVKPVLSANADDTFRLNRLAFTEQLDALTTLFHQRELMIQPFLAAIVEEGEYSLFYFDNQYSHAIVKRPKAGDFRVQEEHGGELAVYQPQPDVLAMANRALDAMPSASLYARVDVVRTDGGWAIMELELIEPSLYFNLDEDAPKRFVDAFHQYIQKT